MKRFILLIILKNILYFQNSRGDVIEYSILSEKISHNLLIS